MKKIFSFIAAVLFAGSMMAESINITPENFKSSYGDGTFKISEVEFAYSGVCYNGKGTPTDAASKQFIQLRKSGSGAGEVKNNDPLNLKSITIATQNDKDFTLSAGTAADKLTAVSKPDGTAGKYTCEHKSGGDLEFDVTIYTFDVTGNSYFDFLNGSAASYIAYITIELADGDTPTPAVATPVISGEASFEESTTVTITCATDDAAIYYTLDGTTPTDASTLYEEAFEIEETTTVKAIAILDEVSSSVASKTFTKVEPLADPTNCAEAAEAALSVSKNNELYNNGKEYTIEGFVTSIAFAWSDGSMSFWMADEANGGNVLEAYKCAIEKVEDAVKVGDKVAVTGKLTKYNTTPEFAAGCTVEMIERAEDSGEEEELTDPTNCAEAREAALSVGANNELYNGGKVYTIEGYVTSIQNAWANGSMTFWMADEANGGNVLEAYKCAIEKEADAVNVGDKVAVTGKLTKYNSTPEFAAGCTVEIIERTAAPELLGEKTIEEFIALKNMKDTCILTGKVISIESEEYGNLTIEDATGELYVYGVLTAAGEKQKFNTLDVAVNDILTIKALYNEFNGTPQAKNAIFVSREKAQVTAIDNTDAEMKVQKVVRDGQLFIIRNGVMFNVTGQNVR